MSKFKRIEINLTFFRQDGDTDVFKGHLLPTTAGNFLIVQDPNGTAPVSPDDWVRNVVMLAVNLDIVPFENRQYFPTRQEFMGLPKKEPV